MKRLLQVLFTLMLPATFAQAQVFEAVIKDGKSRDALPYVNVGIIGKAVGTVSDTDGKFKLALTNDADSLKMSMIGYQSQTYLVADLKKNMASYKSITLEPAIVALKEVKVFKRDVKEAVLGNKTESQSTNAGFTSNKLGNEIGIVIKIKKSPTLIKQFNASIASDMLDSVKLRLNFYSLKDGLPDQILSNRNIFVTVKRGQKKISVDLLPYNIVVEDKFFVSLEWIQNTGGHGIMFSASLLSSFISRETSQANWEKEGLAGVGFNVLAEY
ncbi:MAG: carboxypeptidase-like regulatory domain-containing protein [Bacteroidota bacterium]